MPELPEVETTCKGLIPHVVGRRVTSLVVHQASLRIPVPDSLNDLVGQRIDALHRRAKYLIFETERGRMVIHLGMSGSLRICDAAVPLRKHDHVVIELEDGQQMRYHDPRRFGLVDWTQGEWQQMRWFKTLGPEPLTDDFNAAYLAEKAEGRKVAIKSFIMSNPVVVGVGNIYACEALFMARIHPKRVVGKVSGKRLTVLVEAIKDRLAAAIVSGGTTLRDFVREDGQPGYFKQELMVYGREGEPCRKCEAIIKRVVIGQRSTFYCGRCQR
ncbi:MAG: bifunctional DNA-formamidopyrimidine glycosylase/DNA-(apurinic or apyrimidinic site) lyase [Verrucomicrobiales bacterium]|nr:bifunctional DNA-formamidopyrimidine glycosylase/DNA-(apurinic or apyrimidinic site) lyase [Verrucomicrobiales bacterium]